MLLFLSIYLSFLLYFCLYPCLCLFLLLYVWMDACVPSKNFDIQKWPLQRDGEVASGLVFKSRCFFTFQKCFFIPRIALLFFGSVLLFPWNCPFVFQKCLFILKNALFFFPKLSFSLPEVPSFKSLFTSISKNALFPVVCTFSLSCWELLREIVFALLLFCFLLELFIDQLAWCLASY